MNNGRNRSYIFGIVGAYLIYQAYQIYQNMDDPEAGMSRGLCIFFIVFFTLSAVALFVYAVRLWKASGKEKEKQQPEEDRDELKN